jgi:hypothetical protein
MAGLQGFELPTSAALTIRPYDLRAASAEYRNAWKAILVVV